MAFLTARVWLLVSLCLAAGVLADDLDEEMEEQGVMKIIRAMTNQTKADTLNLPSNATSIRENITDTFSCDSRTYGYYADVDNDCQVFHVCLPSMTRSNQNITYRYSFICPQETVFNQEVLVCTREMDSIDCSDSPMYYYLNMEIGKIDNDTNEEPTGIDSTDDDNEKPIKNTMDSENTATTSNEKSKLMKPVPSRKRNKPKRVSQNGQRKPAKNEKLVVQSTYNAVKDNIARKFVKPDIEILTKKQIGVHIDKDKKGEIGMVTDIEKIEIEDVYKGMNKKIEADWLEDIILTADTEESNKNADTGQIKVFAPTKETKTPTEYKEKDLKTRSKRKNQDVRKARKMQRLERGSIRFTTDVK